jgi:hypothetical protein
VVAFGATRGRFSGAAYPVTVETPMDRFREYLRQQLLFIRNSCNAYDRGDVAEAIRIALRSG